MGELVEIRDVDRRFYEDRLRNFLPQGIVDAHVHVWRACDRATEERGSPRHTVTWPARVAAENPIEDLAEAYRLMLPGKVVTPLIFANVPHGSDLDALNAYVAGCAASRGVPALLFTRPDWSAAEMTERLLDGGFLGAKSYLSLAPGDLPADNIRIFDFFPHHQLAALDRLGLILMLHIPRAGRLKDPVNLTQMLEIERKYPRIRLVVAHVGRAYCDHDVGDAFEVLADSKAMCFDISANTNQWVFEQLIGAVGPRRILFGSDMPVTRMRMRRIMEGGRYVNLVPKGLYGDVSGDKNMAEVEGEEAERLTFFLYEEIDAFRRAAEATGLTARDVQDVFCNNATRMIEAARAGIAAQRRRPQ